MADIRVESHELGTQILSQEQLSRRDGGRRGDGTISADHVVLVDLCVDVDGALNVETRHDGCELGDTLAVGGPLEEYQLARIIQVENIATHDSTEESGVIGVEIQSRTNGNVQLCQQLLERSVRVLSGKGAV